MLGLDDKEFNAIRKIMYDKTGVALKPTKKPLVIARLRKRLEGLGLNNFSAYIHLLEKPYSEELNVFINAITTNETYFFRHVSQFNFLFEQGLAETVQRVKAAGRREVRLWSAACSSGEEPYSLAITCLEYFKRNPSMEFKIYASDINSEVLEEAKEARYSERSLRETPRSIRARYFSPDYELNPVVKGKVEFLEHNLLKTFSVQPIDIIFLRNVMIYFDEDTKSKVIKLLEGYLAPGGYLFISLAETIDAQDTQLKFLGAGIYQNRRTGAAA